MWVAELPFNIIISPQISLHLKLYFRNPGRPWRTPKLRTHFIRPVSGNPRWPFPLVHLFCGGLGGAVPKHVRPTVQETVRTAALFPGCFHWLRGIWCSCQASPLRGKLALPLPREIEFTTRFKVKLKLQKFLHFIISICVCGVSVIMYKTCF